MLFNCKTWIVNNNYLGNLYLYDTNKNPNHIDDLRQYIELNKLNINSDDLFFCSLMLAKYENIVIINGGTMLLIFLPESISVLQRYTLSKLDELFDCFENISIAKITDSNNLSYEIFETEDEIISKKKYFETLINKNAKTKVLVS